MATNTKKKEEVKITLNTLVAAQWFSSDGTIQLHDGSGSGRSGATYMKFSMDEIDKLPKRELAVAYANNLLDIDGWDPLEWLKTNRKREEMPRTNTKRDLTFSLGRNETIWQSKDGNITLSILPGGKTTHKVESGDPQMHEFLNSVRSGRLVIVNKEEDAVKAMDQDPDNIFPELEVDNTISTRAKTWIEGEQIEIIERVRNLVPEDGSLKGDDRKATITFLKVLISTEKKREAPRTKVIESINRALVDLGEFIELSNEDEKDKDNK